MGLCNSVPKGAHGDAFYMPPGAFEDEPTTPAIPHASSKMGPRNPANVSKAQPVIPNVVPDERPLEDQTPLLKKKTPQTSSQVLASSEARDVAMPLPAASKAPKPPKVPQTAPLPGHEPSRAKSKGRLFMSAIPKHLRTEFGGPIKPQEDSGSPARASSTSTIFVSSTMQRPDLDEVLRSVCIAIQYIIQAGEDSPKKTVFDVFNEEKNRLMKHGFNPNQEVTVELLFNFIKTIFHVARLSTECAIILVVYLERMVTLSGLTLQRNSWRWAILGSVLLAAKVWDDMAVWNVDFCEVFPHITVLSLNELERHFLNFLQFNVSVRASVYAKYYFDLRAVSEENHNQFSLKPLDKEGAHKLEAQSLSSEKSIKEDQIRRTGSLDSVGFKPLKTQAVLG